MDFTSHYSCCLNERLLAMHAVVLGSRHAAMAHVPARCFFNAESKQSHLGAQHRGVPSACSRSSGPAVKISFPPSCSNPFFARPRFSSLSADTGRVRRQHTWAFSRSILLFQAHDSALQGQAVCRTAFNVFQRLAHVTRQQSRHQPGHPPL